MSLFFIGIVEMMIISMWTRFVSESKIIASGVISLVNIFIWYYVLQTVTNDMGNISLVMIYATGCAVGTMLTIAGFRFHKQFTESRNSCDDESL
ncbi:hypothetical protein A2239_00170 [Candidatus Uhrbacteria bacterium RIFOXYA2_FULL_40_9]|nr:MAG: hypothetical protein A2239_00170 [Candidatus Uhrbacteria bacterium RIFOXYA2_FULL_40_9]OGL98079.1 MAG: hypothetical protein A2332_03020 [Candidatus Uhrbacteria bacterium RIFOXYB2_FULL_41_18]HBK34378.1 hypothetical protein [Candidatus Uhrbacteria bacterium]HCB55610.1 hypothetical protein [Candidatus Uhrbacteria bacterium]